MIDRSPAAGFRLGGVGFTIPGSGNLMGFYDTLRSPAGDFAGLCCYGQRDFETLGDLRPRFREQLKARGYVDEDRWTIKVVLNGRHTPADVDWGGEQEFDECAVFLGENGEFAMSFGTTAVDWSELGPNRLPGTDFVDIDLL